MTANHRPRPLRPTLALTMLAVVPLLAVGCGSSGSSSPSADSSHSGDSSQNVTARETAETRLEAIPAQLGKVLVVYKSGNKQRAYTMAKSVSATLYEGTTEGIVSAIDPAGERQIDPLLAATIPAAIQSGESVTAVTALIHAGQTLARSCLAEIHKSESGSGG